MNRRPLYPEVGILALVPDQWSPHWQPRHYVLSPLAAYFNVVWMNYPPTWRESFSALQQRRAAVAACPAPPAGLQVYHPAFWLPRIGRPAWLGQFTSRRRLKVACDLLRRQGCKKLVLYIWRPEFVYALEQAPYDLSVYHVDDEYSFSSAEVEISAAERRLLESAGQVFIHSPALLEKKGALNSNTEFVPNGVKYSTFANPAPEPEDLGTIPHPRIGYVGYLKRMLDWPLLLELSAKRPNWSFVFVGDARPHPDIASALEQMSRRRNVYFLGGKETERLGSYPQHFDVCIMPYRMDDYTKYIYPLKMHEYLASGRPVVSAPIRSVQEFRNVITLAANIDDWSRGIERALSDDNTLLRKAERQAVAREYDWDALAARIARTIARRLHIDLATDVTTHPNQYSQLLSPFAPLR
jgi:glycosyltransferase involved in cell wall biosynthesis